MSLFTKLAKWIFSEKSQSTIFFILVSRIILSFLMNIAEVIGGLTIGEPFDSSQLLVMNYNISVFLTIISLTVLYFLNKKYDNSNFLNRYISVEFVSACILFPYKFSLGLIIGSIDSYAMSISNRSLEYYLTIAKLDNLMSASMYLYHLILVILFSFCIYRLRSLRCSEN